MKPACIPLAVVLSAVVGSDGAYAQVGPYSMTHSVIAAGGGELQGGAYRLTGTVGQPATATLTASTYRLYDGFWAPASPGSDLIFANGFDP